MAAPYLSVIIPAYNESARIVSTLEAVSVYLQRQAYSWEIITVDDGSDDATAKIVEQWSCGREEFRLERIRHGGKGAAVRHGMLVATGEYRFMCDADLAMPISHLSDFLGCMSEGNDVVIGSRQIAGANRYGESHFRHLLGRAFNKTVQLIAVRGFQDTQCGFQVFQREGGGVAVSDAAHFWVGLRCGTAVSGTTTWLASSGDSNRMAARRGQQT
ncbi:Dolichyl-phosphate beta-glucosyltransferase ALG5C [Geodia barretti]|uniref:Dolichyl-phosphate beta-glucosyltransferase ALG5C n=1 Tax=Geodia barretti TaxID=519541 RepID=A0AA35WF52_GEOBA|nr:Dolichyl-phosphate beta-glucosyltransferase ALG5C [Geodia barretti]